MPIAATPQDFQKSLKIDAGTAAPFSGVLVSEQVFRFYQSEIDKPVSCPPESPGWVTWEHLAIALLGGVVAGMALK